MVLWPLSPPRLSWSGPPPSQADCGVPQQQCLAPTLIPSPVISSQPAYTGLRVHFWRGKLLPENPLKGSAPSQRTQWFHFHGHNTELMVFGCLPALSLPCDYFCLWHNLPSPLIWFLDGCKLLPTKSFWVGHKRAALSWPCVVTVQTGHPGKRPFLPPHRAGLPFVSTAPGFTNTVLLVFSLPPPIFHPAWAFKNNHCQNMPFNLFIFYCKKWKRGLAVSLQMNNERIPHSCSGIYIFPAVERDGFPLQLEDLFHEAPHLSCSGGRGRWRSVIMDVTGLTSDWSRWMSQSWLSCLWKFAWEALRPRWSGQLQTAPALWLILDSFLISLPWSWYKPSKVATPGKALWSVPN